MATIADSGAVPAQPLPLPQDVWDATPRQAQELILSLIGQVQVLTQQVLTLTARLEALEDQMRANSTNSSKPPSADPPGTLPNRKTKSGKKRGGQIGHQGHYRAMIPSDQVDHILQHYPSKCTKCSRGLTSANLTPGSEPARHQIWEIPPVRADVTEHQFYRCSCPDCGEVSLAKLPLGVSPGAFGPRLTALAGLLTGQYRLSLRQCESLLRDGFGVAVSLGGIKGLEGVISDSLASPVQEVHAAIQKAPVVNADDTGWREANQRAVLWNANTPEMAIFLVTPKKDHASAQALLGENFAGILGVDRAKTYSFHDRRRLQSCWAHLDRHFQRMEDRGGKSTAIGQAGKAEVDRFFKLWREFEDKKLSRTVLQFAVGSVRVRMAQLLGRGIQCGDSGKTKSVHSKTAKTCANILELLPAFFTCCFHEGVDPTNNTSERALRHPVQWRNTSFGTQSAAGSRFVERILTTAETCRRQGRNMLEFLTKAVTALRHGLAAPSLLPRTG